MGSVIGQWVARFIGPVQVTRSHKVESEIEDRVVTRCGRQMPHKSDRGYLLTAATEPCKRCAA